MQSVKLNFNKFNLGELTVDGMEYVFKINEESKKMMLKNGSNLVLFNTDKKEVRSTELFLAFKKFLPESAEKQNLMVQLGVLKSDSDFEKLLKIGKFKLNQDGFWIETKN
ncbi:MAG: hypothetical protein AB7S44_03010 [Spirochaetales bacterium]